MLLIGLYVTITNHVKRCSKIETNEVKKPIIPKDNLKKQIDEKRKMNEDTDKWYSGSIGHRRYDITSNEQAYLDDVLQDLYIRGYPIISIVDSWDKHYGTQGNQISIEIPNK